MRRARTRRERRAREQRVQLRNRAAAVAALVLAAAAAVALPGALIWHQLQNAEIAVDERGCAATDRPRHVVVLIDQTDALAPQWSGFVQQLIPAIAASAAFPAHAQLSVFTLTADPDAPLDAVLAICRPPNPDEGSFLFDTRQQRADREARFEQFYEREIATAVGRTGGQGPRRATPLLEGFVALQALLIAEPAARTELIVVSDMMQFSGALSHYGAYPEFAAFAASRQGAASTALLQVDSAVVDYVVRPSLGSQQDARHRQFWRDYFAAAGVSELEIVDDPLAAVASLPQ